MHRGPALIFVAIAVGVLLWLLPLLMAGYGSISSYTPPTPSAQTTPGITPPAATAQPTAPALPSGEVRKVVDGDTVDVDLDGKVERLRLIGMDTPEVVDPRKPVQCFGKEASAHAHELLDGQRVSVETDATQGDRDRYGRKLAYVWLPDGRNFAETMIREGYAHEYTFGKRYRYSAQFKEAQAAAKANNLGLWSPSTCSGKP